MTRSDTSSHDSKTGPRDRFRWRRLFQYRLRTLLILTAVIAFWLGWWSYTARRQRDAVAALEKAGAAVRYDFQERQLNNPPYWPAWLVNVLPVDYVAKVESVSFWEYLNQPDLEPLRSLTALKTLNLASTRVTDANLEHIEGVTSLESLYLQNTNVTDAGLEHLRGLTSLHLLNLRCTNVTDAGLKRLAALTSLEDLYLGDTRVTDAGLEQLDGLTALQTIMLDHPQISNAGMDRFRKSHPKCFFTSNVHFMNEPRCQLKISSP